MGLADPSYQRIVYHTENETDDKFLEEDSELKKAGVVRKHLGIFQCQNGARKEILTELHSTHMSSEGMKRLARGKFYWTGMSKDIERVYMACEGCKENSRSKPNVNAKRSEVTPSTMETGAPGKLLSTDFG